jgi:hypothetical protein
MTADTPGELLDATERLGICVLEHKSNLCAISVKTRCLAVKMGAIELSRREFVAKLDEINDNGRGFTANL